MLFLLCVLFSTAYSDDDDFDTQMGVDYYHNTQSFQSHITLEDVVGFNVKGNITVCGSVTATATPISKDVVCVADFGKCVGCYNITSYESVWIKNISDYGFQTGYYSRARSAYKQGILVIATASYKSLITPGVPGVGAWVIAIRTSDGSLVWKTQVSTHIYAIVTQDLTLKDGVLFVGLSSGESAAPIVPGYQCCNFSGSTVTLRMSDGQILWSSPNIPEELTGVGGYSGAATWGGAPVVIGGFVYQPSGQLYSIPDSVKACLAANPNNVSCIDSRVMFDGVIKRRVSTGEIVGYFRASSADTWNIACLLTFLPGCQGVGPSYDYDITNIMYSVRTRQIIATSKSGWTWYLDTDLNPIKWVSVAAGSASGGMTWHAALDDDAHLPKLGVFISHNNGANRQVVTPNGTVFNWGFWARHDGDANTTWVTPCPDGGGAYGSLALTNDVLFGSTRAKGLLVFMDKNTGDIVKTIATKGSMTASPLVLKDKLVWPTGPGVILIGGLVDQHQLLVIG